MTVNICGSRFRGSWFGVFCMSFVITCWMYTTYCVISVVIEYHFDGPVKSYSQVAYAFIALVTFASLFHAILSDPGKVYLISQSTADVLQWAYCEICHKYKPPRAHHCSKCNRCVRKMDHHCVWINNCVGEDNMGIFFKCLCYACAQSCISLGLCVLYYISWFPTCMDCPTLNDEDVLNIRIEMFCMTLICSWLFIFTFVLVINRFLMIAADVTTIEMLKDGNILKERLRDTTKPTLRTQFANTFGTQSNIIVWILPLLNGHIIPAHDRLGYEPIKLQV